MPGLHEACSSCNRTRGPGPAAGGCTLLDAAAKHALLLSAQCPARWARAWGRGGEQVGCPPAPSLTPPLQSAARKLAESWLPALLDDAEPRENSEPPRPLLQLRHPQQQGTSESASCPGTKPWEACLRQGVGSARLRLQAEMWPAGVWVLAGGHDHCAPCPPSAVCWGTTWSNEGERGTQAKHLFCGDRGVPSLCQKRAAGLGVLSPHTRK